MPTSADRSGGTRPDGARAGDGRAGGLLPGGMRAGGMRDTRGGTSAPRAPRPTTAPVPNQLRDSVAPNQLRGLEPAGPWLPSRRPAAGRGGGSWAGGEPDGRRRGLWRRRGRDIASIGFVIALAGLGPFFNPEFRIQEFGLGAMCLGVGMVLLALSPGILRSRAATARRSSLGVLAVVVDSPRWGAVPFLGGALLLGALFLLLDAATRS